MKQVLLLAVTMIFAMACGAQAKNHIYGVGEAGMQSEGYKLFTSDKILDTVVRTDKAGAATYCIDVDELTPKNLGNISSIRSDSRLSIAASANISYSGACLTYNAVVARLKTSDDIRKLWLLFGDSATDEYAVETLKKKSTDEEINNEISLLIEMKRLAIVSKYIEFFTKNKDWKLTDYTFLSQAFKSRKGKPLSPAFSQFIVALVTGDAEKAYQVVQSIDLNNLGDRFAAPETRDSITALGSDRQH